jgi:hypothetical protein
MPKRRTANIKATRLSMATARGLSRRGQRDDRELPPFHSPRAGTHSRVKGRGTGKASK